MTVPSPKPERLPLSDPEFTWDRFQAFACDILMLDPGTRRAYQYGKQGDDQEGIDVVVERHDGTRWAVQCRQRARFGKRDAEKTIAETEYVADRYLLFLTCEAKVAVRKACDAAGWEAWDVRDISQRVRLLPLDVARRILDGYFGPNVRQAFLGISGPAPFLSPDGFFGRWLGSEALFNHAWRLVGHADLLASLRAEGLSDRSPAIVLEGRGGSGKSRLLRAYCDASAADLPDTPVRFVADGVHLTPAMLDEIPVEPCVVIVDDAHRRDDLGILYTFARSRPERIRLVLATRPHGTASVLGDLRRAGFSLGEIARLGPVPELKREDRVALARQALGPQFEWLAGRVADATKDSPLVTVVAGQLLVARQIEVGLLEQDEEFRYEVLDRFEDVLLGELGTGTESPFYRQLLQVAAAISPLRDERKDVVAATAEHVGADVSRVKAGLGHLEAVGVLLRRGYSLRITPDVLSDHILARACVSESGYSTGFARAVFDRFGALCAADVLRNLGELDWRLRRSRDNAPDIMAEVWPDIEEQFGAAPNSVRGAILDLLPDVALVQPERTLDLVETAICSPSTAPEEAPWGHRIEVDHEYVLHRIPKILKSISYHPDYLPRCLDLLWELGRDDARATNSHPEHAMRVLDDIAGYRSGKPLAANVAVVDAVGRWLREPGAYDHRHSPLAALAPIFAKSVNEHRQEGHSIVMTSFFLEPEATAPARTPAWELVHFAAHDRTPKVALAGIRLLREALSEPTGSFGAVPSEELRASWTAEQLRAVDALRSVSASTASPIVRLQALAAFRWPARHAWSPEVRGAAAEAAATVPADYDLQLYAELQGLHGRDWRLDDAEDTGDWRARMQKAERRRAALAREFLARNPTARQAVLAVEDVLTDIRSAGLGHDGGFLVGAVARENPVQAAQIAEGLIDRPELELAGYFASLMFGVSASDAESARGLLCRAEATGNVVLCRCVALFFSHGTVPSPPDEETCSLLRRLGRYPDVAVRCLVLGAIQHIASTSPASGVPLALDVEIGAETDVAERFCEAFDPERGADLAMLDDGTVAEVLDKLVAAPDISGYHASRLLSAVLARRPDLAVAFLVSRIERDAVEREDGYHPGPLNDFHGPVDWTAAGESYVPMLRAIRDLALGDTWRHGYYGAHLFRQASRGFCPDSLPVIAEWVESGDARLVRAAGTLLREAPQRFVLENVGFTCGVLRASRACGKECFDGVYSDLFGSAVSGDHSGTPGQPRPRDVAMRDLGRAACERLPGGSLEYRFYSDLVAYAERSIQECLRRDQEWET